MIGRRESQLMKIAMLAAILNAGAVGAYLGIDYGVKFNGAA
jgi:hypothetical protein